MWPFGLLDLGQEFRQPRPVEAAVALRLLPRVYSHPNNRHYNNPDSACHILPRIPGDPKKFVWMPELLPRTENQSNMHWKPLMTWGP